MSFLLYMITRIKFANKIETENWTPYILTATNKPPTTIIGLWKGSGNIGFCALGFINFE